MSQQISTVVLTDPPAHPTRNLQQRMHIVTSDGTPLLEWIRKLEARVDELEGKTAEPETDDEHDPQPETEVVSESHPVE